MSRVKRFFNMSGCVLCQAKVLTISVITVLIIYSLQREIGFSMWDEGFLWYGVQRVLLGEFPILDFMSYDPGRYYWSAALVKLFGGNDIFSVRAAVACFQCFGLFVGLLLVSKSSNEKYDIKFLVVAAAILAAWMFPRHKLFDVSLSIFSVGVLAWLVTNPTRGRYFVAGVGVGLVAFFGRNHGIYGIVGSLGTIAWLSFKGKPCANFLKNSVLWGAGVVVGFLPMIVMLVFVPGFVFAFEEGIRFLFEVKGTNLPLPVPWPWKVDLASVSTLDALREVFVGLFFVAISMFGAGGVLWVTRQKLKGGQVHPVLVAAVFMALPYTHYALSRADVGHLAQGLFPLLIGTLVVVSGARKRSKWVAAICLLLITLVITSKYNQAWSFFSKQKYAVVEMSGKKMHVDPGTAADIALIRELADSYASNGREILVTPFWPGAYALLERKSPMWEIYALFPRSEAFEEKEIERIKAAKPGFALIMDFPLDGRDELRFKNTHPRIYRYIVENFEPVSWSASSNYLIFKGND